MSGLASAPRNPYDPDMAPTGTEHEPADATPPPGEPPLRHTGHLLSGRELKDALIAERIFLSGSWDRQFIKGAGYELRLADDWGAAPVAEGEDNFVVAKSGDGQKLPNPITLGPGDHAVVASHEKFCLDFNITCSISTKFRWAAKGLQVLHGGTAHPTYGRTHRIGSGWAKKPDERLYVVVVNVGPETIYLEPGKPLLYVQFHEIENIEPEEPIPNVGFEALVERFASSKQVPYYRTIRDVRADLDQHVKECAASNDATVERELQLRHAIDKVSAEVARASKGMELVVVFGVFLITTTIFGVLYSGIAGALSKFEDPNSAQLWPMRVATFSYAAFTLTALGAILWTLRKVMGKQSVDPRAAVSPTLPTPTTPPTSAPETAEPAATIQPVTESPEAN